jgi:hypothetical protein
MTDEDPQEAARRSLNPDRLLPGEDPDSNEVRIMVEGELVQREAAEAGEAPST